MKKNKLTMAVVAGIAGIAGIANAQQYINPEGTGQVLIYPYYSVNNGLNTLYSVVNTTDTTKAVKVRFLEGENSLEVLDFNVYMSPFDVWTGALVPTTSTFAGHIGEPSANHLNNDLSCTPSLPDSTEFRPFTIDADAEAGLVDNLSMRRATDGYFEVLEMATFATGGPAANAALHASTTGIPGNCEFFRDAWADDSFTEDVNAPVTGGLFGSATIVNVPQGLSMTYDAIAIDEFWTGAAGSHTNPGSVLPNLGNGNLASVIFSDGVAVNLVYPTGIQAASSLLMREEIYNEYALDSTVAGKSEWVITFPTKNPHVNDPLGVVLPFYNDWSGSDSCHEFGLTIWDREEQAEVLRNDDISPRPPEGDNPSLCYEANVLEFHLPDTAVLAESAIMGSDNLVSVTSPAVGHATENGWARMSFLTDDDRPYVDANGIRGLPVVGFAAQQFTNAGAGEGLLAQYAGLFVHKGLVVVSN